MGKPSLIDKVKSKSTRKAVESTKPTDDRDTWYPDATLEPLVVSLIEAGHISKQLEPVLKEHQTVVYNKLIEMYCEKMWSAKRQPQNPRIVVRKKDSAARDLACMFMVVFRADGLKKYLPNAEDLPDDKEPRDVLVEALMSKLVGLSKANAEKITDPDAGEFKIIERLNFVESLDSMYYGDNPVRKSAAEKILSYFAAEADGKAKKASLEFLTDEEKGVLVTEQLLELKEGFLERACSYCETADQLLNLLKFVKIKFYCQNYEFAIGDDPVQRFVRLEKAVKGIFLDREDS